MSRCLYAKESNFNSFLISITSCEVCTDTYVVLTRLGEGIAPCLQPGRSFTVGERFLTKWVPIEGTLSQSPAFLSATGPLSVKFTSTTIKIPANKTVFEFEKKKRNNKKHLL